MARVRVSTTVDEALLREARARSGRPNDSSLLDEALEALVSRHRSAEVDATYGAYDEQPLSAPDAWSDLASFREAVGR
jgi:hypothetical protein